MGTDQAPPTESGGTGPIPLSTGETVTLPLSTEATMLGAAFAVPRRQVAALLPDELRPMRVTARGKSAVTFLSVEYHRIGDGQIDPYDEFAVVLPAVHESTTTVPYLSALTRPSGYIWYLPVTTEPAKALGVDVWGFPKVVADITHADDGARRRTTVTVDGDRFITFETRRPPSMATRKNGHVYAVKDDELRRVPTEVVGEIGAWPFSDEVSVTFGEAHRAEPLRELDIGDRALARVSVEGEAWFYPGEPPFAE
ncbi:acetoacetate decarboxylase family protein [Halogeometricum sp. S1BR25-6]|uniref:Acetoacetate decarboxylase family protein n=1 Tax=Halogeometricum salsisoli TaxID=2950536 RepID=A0ABU2GCJ9_9EURY|nr:acetoacetate decarboxylase family protein [Halogeometricum sp. S1BR25-6]MDS0297909.1 acetoacetate decarboxylase family protein [Halogeometricum sp. S1BR25-6]